MRTILRNKMIKTALVAVAIFSILYLLFMYKTPEQLASEAKYIPQFFGLTKSDFLDLMERCMSLMKFIVKAVSGRILGVLIMKSDYVNFIQTSEEKLKKEEALTPIRHGC